MPRIIVGFLVGVFIGGGAATMLSLSYARNQFEVGKNAGKILTQLEIMEEIRDRLGSEFSSADGYDPLFEVKADAVVIVERNGTKTLRVHAPGLYAPNPKTE